MATLIVRRLSQNKNRYGSYAYQIMDGEPEDGTKLYGEEEDILYSNQKIGIWNQPTEVQQYLRNGESGKVYTGLSIDQEMNSFSQRGHTANLAVKAGLDAKKIGMLKMISELDEQELRVALIQTKMKGLNPAANRSANPSVQKDNTEIEEAEVLSTEEFVKAKEEELSLT